MIPPFEITDVDLSNPGIQRVLEVFGAKYEQKYKEVADLKKKNTAQAEKITAQAEEIAALNSRIQQLEEAMAEARPKGQGGGNKNQRSYNARKFKEHIREERRSNSREYVTYEGEADATAAAGFRTVDRTADIKFCPVHGTPLSKTSNSYPGTTEDAGPDGAWRIAEWTVLRRYCAACGAQHSAPVWGVMPREHFGNNIIAQTCAMRNPVMSFETIQKIFLMMYGRLVHTSTLEELYDSAADMCRPLYDGMERGLKNTETMATIYTTCEMRRVNPYHFLRDYLDGKLDAIPNPARDKKPAAVAAAAAGGGGRGMTKNRGQNSCTRGRRT